MGGGSQRPLIRSMPKMTDRTTISMRAATRTLLALRRTLSYFRMVVRTTTSTMIATITASPNRNTQPGGPTTCTIEV